MALIAPPAVGDAAAFVVREMENVSSRSNPATNRLRFSKLSTITANALSMAANAPAAWMARPTSSSPESTREATMALGSMMVRKP
ncbi:hypothetical protein D9M72_354640 [compost metagenome]